MNLFDQLAQNPQAAAEFAVAVRALGQQFNNNQQVFKETTLTAPPNASIYGRLSIFDACASGDIFGLQVETHGLMNWLGWRPNRFYRRRVDFIQWWGPQGTAAGAAQSAANDPCDDPISWEYGDAGYELLHTSWYSLAGEALDPKTVVQERCETSPRYRLDGTLISDDVEWQMNGIMNVIQQSVRRDLIHGDHTNDNEMDGLNSIIKTGYTDKNSQNTPAVDSIIIDWDNDDLDGDTNGFGNFFDYVDEIVTEIEYRCQNMGTIAEQDMIILTSRFMATKLLDAYACYTTCGVTSTSDITDQALRAQQRAERRALNGGPLYDGRRAVGYIHLKSGRRLPIMVEDNVDIATSGGNYCTDIYILTRRIGSRDVFYGEYLDLRTFQSRVQAHDPGFAARTDQAGRFLIKGKEDNFCVQLILGTSPELYLAAPWAQVRIQNVCSDTTKRKPLVGDPYQPTYHFTEGALYTATSYE